MNSLLSKVGTLSLTVALLFLAFVAVRGIQVYRWKHASYNVAEAPDDIVFDSQDTTLAWVPYEQIGDIDMRSQQKFEQARQHVRARKWLLDRGFLAQDTLRVNGQTYIHFQRAATME